jgi:hypothetical protein
MVHERKIERGRSLSKQNKLLLMADNILFDIEKVLKEKKIRNETDRTIIKDKLRLFLRAVFYLTKESRSLDQWFDGYSLSDKAKEFVADAFITLWEVETMFREEWYGKDYLEKGKVVSKMPETGPYREDILKHFTIIAFHNKPQYGKKITWHSIDKDVQEFRIYLQERHFGETGNYPDGVSLRKKRFRYLAFLAGNIKIFFSDTPKAEKKEFLKSKPIGAKPTFPMDEYIKKAIWKPRNGYGVGIMRWPGISMEGQG